MPFRHLVPTLTFFTARTDYIYLYPNNDLNHTLRAGEYITSPRSPVFTGAIQISILLTYLLTYLLKEPHMVEYDVKIPPETP